MTETRENYAIIIGSMKSGTTTLFSILAHHPAIAPARNKEPGFFAFPEIYAKGFDWFHSIFDFDPDRHVYRLEASTDYTKEPFVTGVWDRMQARPNARYKLIYIMRHPIKRLQSHARHVQFKRKEIGQNVTDREDHSLDNGVSLAALNMSAYARQLDAFAEVFEAGDLFLVTLEELKSDTARVAEDLWAFLDLPPVPLPDEAPRANAARDRVQTHKSWKMFTSNRAVLAIGKQMVPQAVRHRLKAKFTRKVAVEGRFAFTDDEAQMLEELLAADMGRLEEVYGVRTRDNWGLPSATGNRV